jgi:hypothetical protein
MREQIVLPNLTAIFGGATRKQNEYARETRERRKLSEGLPYLSCQACGETWSPDDSDTCMACEWGDA